MNTLILKIFEAFSKAGFTLATAESCTGGLLATGMTDLSGSSKFYLGGISSYSNDAKMKLLGVKKVDLDKFGAVSKEVSEAMALGARAQFESDFAVSITGVAGPDGGTLEKPVGMVWVGISSKKRTVSKVLKLQGSRSKIRTESARLALEFLLEEVNVC